MAMQAAARWLRTIFLAGLAVVVPVVLTAYLVWFVFSRLDALMAGVVAAVVGRPVPGGGVVASLALVLAVGVVATNFLGRRVIRAAEQFVERIPGSGPSTGQSRRSCTRWSGLSGASSGGRFWWSFHRGCTCWAVSPRRPPPPATAGQSLWRRSTSPPHPTRPRAFSSSLPGNT